jgi:LysM repeat protein
VSRFGMAIVTTAVALAAMGSAAGAAVPHTVAPGETLWSIAAQNNLTTSSVAAYNGLSEDAQVYVGQTIQIPTEAEGAAVVASSGATSAATSPATTSGTAHVVQPGETLTSVAAANGVSTATLAAANGLAEDAMLISGQEITIPTSGASATTASATPSSSALSPSSTALSSPPSSPPPEEHPSWTSPIYCPSCPNGEAYLASNAAYNWNAMRQASLDTYGIDLYPAGPLSAYRSYGQQLYLYDLYLSGQGNLAASPGTSSHEYGAAVDLADPAMANVIHQIGAAYGWAKIEAPSEWWHVSYVGP